MIEIEIDSYLERNREREEDITEKEIRCVWAREGRDGGHLTFSNPSLKHISNGSSIGSLSPTMLAASLHSNGFHDMPPLLPLSCRFVQHKHGHKLSLSQHTHTRRHINKLEESLGKRESMTRLLSQATQPKGGKKTHTHTHKHARTHTHQTHTHIHTRTLQYRGEKKCSV